MKYKVTHRHHEGPAPAGQLAPPAGGRRGRHDGGRGHLAPRGRQNQVKYFTSDEIEISIGNYNNIFEQVSVQRRPGAVHCHGRGPGAGGALLQDLVHALPDRDAGGRQGALQGARSNIIRWAMAF